MDLLIIDDDLGLNQMLGFHFEDQGHTVAGVYSCTEAVQALAQSAPDLILLDQHLPDGTGMDILAALREAEATVPVIMMTGVHDLELAIEAIKEGAREFVHKPIKTDELDAAVARVMENQRLLAQHGELDAASEPQSVAGNLIGRGAAMLKVSKEIALTADSNASVLVLGESGTGKEVVARMIHQHSGRSGPFIAVNCAAIVDNLLESELFGHEKGAFTGAIARKAGKFELASEGTLFLDEIGELALPLQAKLLRVLQEGSFERVGGNETLTTGARIVAATNRDLDLEVRERRFREDLLYRLNVVAIGVPPLRARKEDIRLLYRALMQRIAQRVGRPPLALTDPAYLRMMEYDWPGNVRELENVLTQAMVHAPTGVLTPDLLALAPPDRVLEEALEAGVDGRLPTLDELESRHIQRVLSHTGGHKGRSCEILGISRPALDRKIKRYQLIVPGR